MAVYFIAEEGTERVKIGHSTRVWRRMLSLQAETKQPLILMRAIRGGRAAEIKAHAHFAAQHIEGEWFVYSDSMFDYGAPIDVGLPPRRRQIPQPHDDIIDALGGTNEVSRLFGIAQNTVANWRQRGIPGRYQYAFAQHCTAKDIKWRPPVVGAAQ